MHENLTTRIDLSSNRELPKYSRVKERIETEMLEGRLAPGEALPTELDLARSFGVGRNTVRQALSELERDGFVRRIRGKGTFVQDQRRMRSRRELDTLALVMNDTKYPAHVSLLQGFEAGSRDMQLHTLVRTTENDVAQQGNVLFHLLDYGLQGVALVPTSEQSTPAFQIRQLQKHGIPVVFCHRGVEGIQAPLVPIPFRDVGRMAAEVFLKHGHRRVAAFFPHPAAARQEYIEGIRTVMRTAGGDLPAENIFVGNIYPDCSDADEKEVFEALKGVYSRDDRPTAIFTSADVMAELIHILLGRMGLNVPGDISLVSEGGPWREGTIVRQLTSVIIQEEEMGRRALQLLLEMRDGRRSINDNERVVVPLDFHEGRTLGPPAEVNRDIQEAAM